MKLYIYLSKIGRAFGRLKMLSIKTAVPPERPDSKSRLHAAE